MADTISLLLCFLCFMTGLLSGSSKEEIIKQVVAREWQHKSYTFAGIGQTWSKEEKETFSFTCGVGNAAEIWFISNYVKLDDAFSDSVLYVDLDAELTWCVNERTSTKVPCHSNIFEIYVYRGESQPPIPSTQKLTYLLSNFYPVYNITNKTSPNSVNRRENQTFIFKRNNTKGVTFAIRSRGACGKLYHMKMYYFYCEKTFIDGVMFEKTASPAVGFRNVTGNCSPNSQPRNNGTKPKGFCHSNGSWGADYQIKCLCSEGYETSNEKGCSACTKDYYKETVSNSKCNPCPSNTVSLNNRTACECKENFYNLANDRLKPTPCYALPAMNGNPTANGVGGGVNVTWSQASTSDSLNESVLYDVECFSCDNDVCNGSCVGAAYNPGQHNLSQTFVVVSYLKSHLSFEFRIYPKNSLNELVSKEKWNFTTARYERLQMKPTAIPSAVRDLSIVSTTASTVKLKWQPPENSGNMNDSVLYDVQCFKCTGKENVSPVRKSKSITVLVLSLTFGVFLLILVCLFGLFLIRQRKKRKDSGLTVTVRMEADEVTHSDSDHATVNSPSYGFPLNNYTSVLFCDLNHAMECSWEFPKERLIYSKDLGSGNFGTVKKALALPFHSNKQHISVAVKLLKETANEKDREDFKTELDLMKKLERHPYVVQFFGCSTKSELWLMIMVYLPGGDLLGFLRKSRGLKDSYNTGELMPSSRLDERELLSFSWMVAEGMSFLASHEIVHRDLAARNILVGEDNVCKLSDFGLAREGNYNRKSQARLPIKWMAPEDLFHGQSTTMSDVWSYGILLWEIFTIGSSPYPGYKAHQVVSLLETSYRMPSPRHCSEKLYSLMMSCWNEDPGGRPGFSTISHFFQEILNDDVVYLDMAIYDEHEYMNFDAVPELFQDPSASEQSDNIS